MLKWLQSVKGNSAQECSQLLIGNMLKNLHHMKGNNAQMRAACEELKIYVRCEGKQINSH
jgi:hypothetical protein